MPAMPEPGRDRALVHRPRRPTASGPPRAGRACRRTAAGTGAPRRSIPARDDRLAVVGEADRRRRRAARPSRSARSPARPRVIAARKPTGTGPRACAASTQRAEHGGAVDDGAGVGHRHHGAVAAGRGGRGAGVDGPPCTPGRGCAGGRGGRRRPGNRCRPAAVDRLGARRAPSAPPGSPSSAICPSRMSTSSALVEPGARVEHVDAADQQVGRLAGARAASIQLRLGDSRPAASLASGGSPPARRAPASSS